MRIIKVARIEDENPLDTAARVIGGRNLLAQGLGVTAAAVGNWKTRGVPIEYCPKIETLTMGEVSRQDLRPDDWQALWPELAQAPTTHNTTQGA